MLFWFDDGINGWRIALMIISMLAFWGLPISFVIYLVRQSSGSAGLKDGPPRTPEQMLAARFARGEIDENEYTGRVAALHGKVLS